MKKIYYFLLISTIFIALGCKKYTARKLQGFYSGEVLYFDKKPLEPISELMSDTTIEVQRDGKELVFLNLVIHNDSIESNGYFEFINPSGAGGVNFVLFKNDSLICRIYEKYKFGFEQFIEYRLSKE